MRVRWVGVVALAATALAACGRPDARITTAVQAKFAADDQVKAHPIDVMTERGVVILNGSVHTEEAKARALELSRGTSGVSRVIDNLTVKPAKPAPADVPDAVRTSISDTALTAAIKSSFLADPQVRGLTIDVETIGNVVTLTGEVRSQDEKVHALQVARETPGVRSVTDRLTIKP